MKLAPLLRRDDELLGGALTPRVGTEAFGALGERRLLRLPLPERARRAEHGNAADVHESPDVGGRHGAQQLLRGADAIAFVRFEPPGGLGRSVDDDRCPGQEVRPDLIGQVGADPLVHVRIVGVLGPTYAPHAEAAAHELPADCAAEKPAGAREDREWAGTRRHALSLGNGGGRRNRAPDVGCKLLVDSGDVSQVVDADGRLVARSGRGVEV